MKLLKPQSVVLTSSTVANSAYADWNIATAYVVGNKVYLPSNYGEYECLVNNTGVSPETDVYNATTNPTGKWLFLGTTNKYKMFDQFLNTQTVNTGSIVVDIVTYGASGVFLGNLVANSVQIDIIDNDSLATIETVSYSMYNDVLDWQDYFFGDWLTDTKDSIMYERTTLTQNISMIITIDNGINDAKCGICAIGKIKDIGSSTWNVKVGALDYSTVSIDTSNGITYLSQGNYAKTLSIDVLCDTDVSNAIYKALIDARGTPIVIIGGGNYDVLNLYCYIQKFEEVLKGEYETLISCDGIGLV